MPETFLKPKEKFINRGLSKPHADLVSQGFVQDCLELALLHMLVSQANGADGPTAVRDKYKLDGAREFIHIFLNLSTVQEKKTPLSSGTLVPDDFPPGQKRKP